MSLMWTDSEILVSLRVFIPQQECQQHRQVEIAVRCQTCNDNDTNTFKAQFIKSLGPDKHFYCKLANILLKIIKGPMLSIITLMHFV